MKILKRLFVIATFCLIAGGVFLYLIINTLNTPQIINTPQEIIIKKGTSLNQTAQLLAQKKIIKNAELFILYARLNKLSSKLKAGEYLFENAYSIKDVAQKLIKGDVINRSITIPEGKALVEILEIINNHPHLTGKITISLKEGDILPETYHFTKGTSRNEIIQKSKLAMQQVLENAYKNISPDSPIKSKEEYTRNKKNFDLSFDL